MSWETRELAHGGATVALPKPIERVTAQLQTKDGRVEVEHLSAELGDKVVLSASCGLVPMREGGLAEVVSAGRERLVASAGSPRMLSTRASARIGVRSERVRFVRTSGGDFEVDALISASASGEGAALLCQLQVVAEEGAAPLDAEVRKRFFSGLRFVK